MKDREQEILLRWQRADCKGGDGIRSVDYDQFIVW